MPLASTQQYNTMQCIPIYTTIIFYNNNSMQSEVAYVCMFCSDPSTVEYLV